MNLDNIGATMTKDLKQKPQKPTTMVYIVLSHYSKKLQIPPLFFSHLFSHPRLKSMVKWLDHNSNLVHELRVIRIRSLIDYSQSVYHKNVYIFKNIDLMLLSSMENNCIDG